MGGASSSRTRCEPAAPAAEGSGFHWRRAEARPLAGMGHGPASAGLVMSAGRLSARWPACTRRATDPIWNCWLGQKDMDSPAGRSYNEYRDRQRNPKHRPNAALLPFIMRLVTSIARHLDRVAGRNPPRRSVSNASLAPLRLHRLTRSQNTGLLWRRDGLPCASLGDPREALPERRCRSSSGDMHALSPSLGAVVAEGRAAKGRRGSREARKGFQR